MTDRGKWQGMWTIVRFNWPLYAGALGSLMAASLVSWAAKRLPVKVVGLASVAASAYFLFGSLGVSNWIYDRSILYRWTWLRRVLPGGRCDRLVVCHSGFDEVSSALRSRVEGDWTVLDHFDPVRMTEASIRRARQAFPPQTGTVPAAADHWPLANESTDVVFALLAIHELRSEAERIGWFREARRCLRDGGRVILIEHVRDLANFVAFGPGALHFHSVPSWRRCWEAADLRLIDSFKITAWVRAFVVER